MSISTLQEKFFNKGCGTALIVVAAVAMGASMFSNRMTSAASSREEGRASRAVATVGGVPVLADSIQRGAESMMARLSSGGPPDPMTQAIAAVRATGAVLQESALSSLLTTAPVTEAEASELIRLQIEARRSDLVKQGKLKAGASDQDLERAMKDELKGKTLAQVRQEQPKAIVAAFKDPQASSAIIAQLGAPILAQRYGEKAASDDQALRDSYKSYIVRRVFLSSTSGTKETPEVRAARAAEDLKAGKSFETEMDTVSNDPAPLGKKIHEATETVAAATLSSRPELSSLVGKAPNATTPVVDVPGGKAIYQLVWVKDGLPTDFEANKAKYRTQKIQEAGGAEVERRVKALLTGGAVKWQSLGYQALAATSQALQPIGEQVIILDAKAALAAGTAAVKSENPSDRRLGAQALLVATYPKFVVIKTPDAPANRIAALSAAAANGIEDAALSLELAGLYGDVKDGTKATDALIAASKANSDFEAKGQRTFGDIAAKALDLQKKGVMTKLQLDSVQAQQALWTAQRADSAKASTQAKSDAAKEKAENDAEIARQKAEAATSTGTNADVAGKKANDAEIARQKSEAARRTPGAAPKPAGPGR